MKHLDKMNVRLKKFSDMTGIKGRDLAKIDQEDLLFVCSPTMRMKDPVVLSGPPLSIDRGGRTAVLPRSRSQEFSDQDRAVMKAMDLSEEDYREHADPEDKRKPRDLKTLPEATKASFKDKLDSALGLSEADYAQFG